jgi:hypothetical protein
MSRPEQGKREQSSFTTNRYLLEARAFDFRYGISRSLGLGMLQRRDREGVRLTLANIALNESIRERSYRLDNPGMASGDVFWGENTSDLHKKLEARRIARA